MKDHSFIERKLTSAGLVALQRYYIEILFAGIASVLLLSTHDAAATTTSLDGSAACISLGGSWDNPTSTCSVHNLVINAGDSLDILSGVTLSIGPGDALDNSGTINILSGGHLAATGARQGFVALTNRAGGEVNNQGSMAYENCRMENSGTINNKGNISIDNGALFNAASGTINNNLPGTITASGVTGEVNRGTINNRGIIAVTNEAGLENDGTLNNNWSGHVDIAAGTEGFGNTGTLNNNGHFDAAAPVENLGIINNRGSMSLLVFFTNSEGATLNNSGGGTFINQGGLANFAIINNHALIDNRNNQIDNENSGTINNTFGTIDNRGGIINNHCAGTINNHGTILGNPVNNECP